jgi:hypothetical protein
LGREILKKLHDEQAQCPLLAQSGHRKATGECPLSDVKRTSAEFYEMSAQNIMASGHTGRAHGRTQLILQQRQKFPARAVIGYNHLMRI